MTLRIQGESAGHRPGPDESADAATSALFRTFFQISPDGIVLLDNKDRVLRANPAFLDLFGYELDEVLGKPLNDLIVDSEFRVEASELSERALNNQTVCQEALRRRRNGDLISVEIYGTPLMLDDRQVGIYAIYRDITARREAEDLLAQSEAKHRTIVESMPDGYFETDLSGNLLFFNQSLGKVLGIDPDELRDFNTRRQFDSLTSRQLFEQFNEIYRTGRTNPEVCWQFETPEGEMRHLEATVSSIHADNGEPVGFRGVVRNVTERIQAIRALRESEELFRLVSESTGQLIYDYDLDSGGIRWSGAVESVLGIDTTQTEDFDVEQWAESIHPDDRDRCMLQLEQTNRTGEAFRMEYRLRRHPGDYIDIEDRGAYIRDDDGRPLRMIGTMSDVSERRRQEKKITYQATHDALTGLSNRYHFEEAANQLTRDARHSGRKHSLLYMDLDQFKVVNDTCGHNAGDELLRQLASQVRNLVRHADILARLGGDEFGLLLADCDIERATKIAEKVIREVNALAFEWEERTFSVGISIGVVKLDGRLEFNDLLKAADQACYLAKDRGRNRCHVYHDEDFELRRRSAELRAAADVNTAISENRFELYVQRIASLQDGDRGEGHEVLLRMRTRDNELVPPGQFILGAERYNRMNAIDRWVVENALKRIGLLCEQGRMQPGHWISINLSGSSIHDADFGDFVRSMIARYSVDPVHVCFEITESSAIMHHKDAVRFLQSVRELGCRIMLDDFGSGLASFAYLKTLPIDFIKVDGSLIRDMTRSEFNLAIVRSIQEIARVLGKPLIAEHVETAEVNEMLRTIGVDFAQGFYLHRPEPWNTEAD